MGSIIIPVLEKQFECRYFDIKPVKGYENRTIIADVADDDKVRQAAENIDAVVYLAMGVGKNPPTNQGCPDVNDINAAFNVNVCGLYKFLYASLAAGANRFIYASTLSVYSGLCRDSVIDENVQADSWIPYGLSKRTGEFVCSCAAQNHQTSCVTAIRLIQPKNDQDWPNFKYDPNKQRNYYATGPKDTQNLFTAAVKFYKPGFHLFQASGDMQGRHFPNDRVKQILGWMPKNE